MTRSRSQIQADIDQAKAAAEAYQSDIDNAMEGRRVARAEIEQHLAELARTHYGDEILEHLTINAPEIRSAEIIEEPNAHRIVGLLNVAGATQGRALRDIEVFVAIDPALLADESRDLGKVHMWPVAAGVDTDGDVILYVTSGDRAQS